MSGENMGSAFSVPGQNASVSYTLPQNVERAVISLSACGQATEEFWYSNTFNSDVSTFDNSGDTLYGFSPFREVQLLIDGQLAGFVAFAVTFFLPKTEAWFTKHVTGAKNNSTPQACLISLSLGLKW